MEYSPKSDRLLRRVTNSTAMKTLMHLSRSAEQALRASDKKDLPAEAKERARKLLAAIDDEPAGDNLLRLRATQAFALADTRVTRELLGKYAKGAPGAFLTEEAKAALGDAKK